MKKRNYRKLGLKIALCGAVITALALAALLRPCSALTIIPGAENARVLLRDRVGVTNEMAYLTPEQTDDLRAKLTETELRWDGRRPEALQFWRDKPLYRLILDTGMDGFEMVGSHIYSNGWSYRLSEKDAERLSELLDSFFA